MTDFEKMGIMAKRDMDIRMSTTLVSANKVKAGGYVTMGVDGQTLLDLVMYPEKYRIGLYVINNEQFMKVANEDDPHFVNSLPQAIHVLTYQLRCDKDYNESWKANIAMAFQDAYAQYQNTVDEQHQIMSKTDIHTIANDAAKQFLANLTRTEASNE